jgi:hypothetical protein
LSAKTLDVVDVQLYLVLDTLERTRINEVLKDQMKVGCNEAKYVLQDCKTVSLLPENSYLLEIASTNHTRMEFNQMQRDTELKQKIT